MTTQFIAYIRVSTQRQGQFGASLQEQKRAITSFAATHSLSIIAWHEERTSAAKRGRPVFKMVMSNLQNGYV